MLLLMPATTYISCISATITTIKQLTMTTTQNRLMTIQFHSLSFQTLRTYHMSIFLPEPLGIVRAVIESTDVKDMGAGEYGRDNGSCERKVDRVVVRV